MEPAATLTMQLLRMDSGCKNTMLRVHDYANYPRPCLEHMFFSRMVQICTTHCIPDLHTMHIMQIYAN